MCGDPVVWKPSEKTPLTALACEAVFRRALERFDGDAPGDLLTVLVGRPDVGNTLVDHPRVPLVPATGSTRTGSEVGPRRRGASRAGSWSSVATAPAACVRRRTRT